MTSLRLWSTDDEARMWLVCLPSGGGSAHGFRSWSGGLPATLGMAALELPGHGSRAMERPARNAGELVAALAADLAPLLSWPVIFFGHSMGAILALDVTRALRASHGWRPSALVVAASSPPDKFPAAAVPLSDNELAVMLRGWNGTSDELFADSAYLAEILATLRADLELMTARVHRDEAPLDCPIHVYLGSDDATVNVEAAVTG